MAQQNGQSLQRVRQVFRYEEQLRANAQFLEENPDMKVRLRLMFLYGRVNGRGTVLYLNWSRAADYLLEICTEAIKLRGVCNLALSGGKTPEALFRALARQCILQPTTDWQHIHLFWSDERYVPHDDPRSNFALAYEAWLREAPIPRENLHPMPTRYANPEDAARAYEAELRAHFGDADEYPMFDIVLLGMGNDGHIASLFPGDPALEETERWVVPSRAPAEPRQRLTLTLPVLKANHLWFLVAGESKAPLIDQLFAGTIDPTLPVAMLGEELTWLWWLSEELFARAFPYTRLWWR
jgi:6-phosphogluconolactonase